MPALIVHPANGQLYTECRHCQGWVRRSTPHRCPAESRWQQDPDEPEYVRPSAWEAETRHRRAQAWAARQARLGRSS